MVRAANTYSGGHDINLFNLPNRSYGQYNPVYDQAVAHSIDAAFEEVKDHLGPLVLFYEDGGDWTADFDVTAGASNNQQAAIGASTLANGQTAMFRMSGMTAGQTYRIEFVRDFEGVPRGDKMSLGGSKTCQLVSAASALELLQ
jgi:hypothetical protein